MKNEKELINSWQYGSIEKPLVSICCLTFNHSEFLEKCLKGFLGQQTKFSFEILIYDDFSTDCNQEIISKYHLLYPNIIKPILSSENQYSRGEKVNYKYNFLRASGTYIALCEGDDYWHQPEKLELQISFMQSNPNVGLTWHRAILNNYQEKSWSISPMPFLCKYFYFFCFLRTGGGFIPTNSIIFKKKSLSTGLGNWLTKSPVGDAPIKLWHIIHSDIYFLNENLSTSNRLVNGSWSLKHSKDNAFKIEHLKKIIEFNLFLLSLKECKKFMLLLWLSLNLTNLAVVFFQGLQIQKKVTKT